MAKYDDEVLSKLTDIAKRHFDCIKEYQDIQSLCPIKKMSRGIDLYGMYYPDQAISKYITYHGKPTDDENRRHYSYFFDEQNRLRLTERYVEDYSLYNIIFYFYYDNLVEIVWYRVKDKTISLVGFMDYENGVLSRFIQSYDFNYSEDLVLESFREFGFDADGKVVTDRVYSPKIDALKAKLEKRKTPIDVEKTLEDVWKAIGDHPKSKDPNLAELLKKKK